MATKVLTTDLILAYKKQNPSATALDIYNHFMGLKDTYTGRDGNPVRAANIRNIFTKYKLVTPVVAPKGYVLAEDAFKELSILKRGYQKMVNRPNLDGTVGSAITRYIDRELKPKVVGPKGGSKLFVLPPSTIQKERILELGSGFNKLRQPTIDLMKKFDGKYKVRYAAGDLPLWPEVTKDFSNITRSQAGKAFARLGQWYQGQKFVNDSLKGLPRDEKTGVAMLEAAQKSGFGNFYNHGLNEIALSTIDEKLGNKSGTFKSFKDKARKVLKQNNIPIYFTGDKSKRGPFGFNINEIVGTQGRARSRAPEFSQFVDVLEGKINQTSLAQYQTGLAKATETIEANPNNPDIFKTQSEKINTRSAKLEKDLGIRLAKIRPASDVSKYYTDARLEKLKGQKLDIKAASERAGYTFEMPKGTKTITEFVDDFGKDPTKLLRQFTAAVRGSGNCQTIIKNAFMASGGRVPYAGGQDACAKAVEANPEAAAKIINQIPEQSGPLNKVKAAASKFLSVAKKGGRFGAFAAVGAAGAGLVKEFRNDDPSTYLSSEGQQKNMLIDMVTQPVSTPTETPSTAFGDAQLPAIGAVTAAGMIPGGAELYKQRTGAGAMKRPLGGPRLDAEGAKILKNRVSPFRAALGPMSGVLGKGLAATGTPLGMLALEPLYIGQQIADGDSAGEIATNPLNYLGPAFAGSLSKEATRFAGPKMANFMRLGISPMALKTVSRRFGLPGLGISAGISGYEMYQNKKAGRGLFDDG